MLDKSLPLHDGPGMTAHELADKRGIHLIHVLPPEVFESRRIPGSKNACVYEVAFLDHVSGIAARDDEIVVYGAGGGSLDATTAAERLAGAGFTRVTAFQGGLLEWQAAGLPLEGTGSDPKSIPRDGVYQIDTTKSVIRWTGRNLFNHHSGTVRLAGGELEIRSGRCTHLRVDADLHTIACEDIGDAAMNEVLIRHLASPDFFDTAKHPIATFAAREVHEIDGASEGTPGHRIAGELTIRGITRPFQTVFVAGSSSPDEVTGQAQITIDRTEFGSLYGSGRFFRFLGQHLVNDEIHLHVKIHARREG